MTIIGQIGHIGEQVVKTQIDTTLQACREAGRRPIVDSVALMEKASERSPFAGWALPETLAKLLSDSPHPHVGTLPTELASKVSSEDQLYTAFDQIAATLKTKQQQKQMTYKFGNPTVQLQIERINDGFYGTVYRVSGNGHPPYALKIWKHEGVSKGYDGAYPEIAVGQYLRLHGPFKDVAQFYTGNPKGGWAIFEYITPDMVMEARSGSYIRDKLPMIKFTDNMKAGNWIAIQGGHVRVDMGGLERREIQQDITSEKFTHVISQGTLYARQKMASKLKDLAVSERLATFEAGIASNETKIQIALCSEFKFLPANVRLQAFEKTMPKIPPEVQGVLIKQLEHIPPEERMKAFELAMDIGDSNVKQSTVWELQHLFEHDQFTGFERAIETQDPEVQKIGVWQIPWLPKAERFRAFQRGLEVNDRNIKAHTAINIRVLPEDERLKGLELAMSTNDTEVQKEVIDNLLENMKVDALEIVQKSTTN